MNARDWRRALPWLMLAAAIALPWIAGALGHATTSVSHGA
jgi:hypothetical protein